MSAATTELYTLSLHDALPIYPAVFVVQYKCYFGRARTRKRLRAGEDQLAHSPGPQYPGALLTDREEHGVSDVALADRKSTRLNSSHGYISYAVFCLKKKTKIS